MFIHTDRMDGIMYRHQRQDNPGLPELEQNGVSKGAKSWPAAVGDLWAGLFKAAPKFDETAKGPLATAMKDVIETEQWKRLRTQTALDEFGSSVGTVSFGRNLLESLPPEVLQAQEAQEEYERAVAAAAANRADRDVSRESLKRAIADARNLEKKAQALAQKANEKCGGDVDTVVRIAAREAAEKATEETAQGKELASGWGMGAGTAKRIPVAEQIALARKMEKNGILKLVAKFAGRMKRLAQGFQAKKVNRCPEEIVDVETGNNLRDVIPSEYAGLAQKSTKLRFLKRYMNRELMLFKKQGVEKAGKGPIVLVRDESGSMTGNPFAWACGIGLALAWIAQKQKRSLILGGFSAGGQFWSREYPGGVLTPADIEHWASHYFGGGTDFEMALQKSMDAIKASKKMSKADLVFLSDGDCWISAAFKAQFKAEKGKLGLRVISIGVGCSEESFKDFSDVSFGLRGNLDKDDEALERVFSI